MVADLEVVTGRKSAGDVRPKRSATEARPKGDNTDVRPKREGTDPRPKSEGADGGLTREGALVRTRRDGGDSRTRRGRRDAGSERDGDSRTKRGRRDAGSRRDVVGAGSEGDGLQGDGSGARATRGDARAERDGVRTRVRPEREGPRARSKGRDASDVRAQRSALDLEPDTEQEDVEQPVKARTAGAGAARAQVAVARTPRTPFVLLILALLGGALVSLLLLNTVLAQDAFTLNELQQSNKQLKQQQESLQEDIAREEAPQSLAQKAKALGMIQPNRPAFMDLRTGQVIGGSLRPVPRAAAAAAGAAGVLGVPGAVVPGDGIPGWTGGEPTDDPKITTPGESP